MPVAGETRWQESKAASEPRLKALGAFIWRGRDRIRVAASCAEAPIVIECTLRGGSMSGLIAAGSRVRVIFGDAHWSRGEVVAFIDGARIVVHRVVYRGYSPRARNYLITQGDAMSLPDPPIAASAVLGTVVAVHDAGGWRPLGARIRPPRRDRLLSFLVLLMAAACMEASPRLAGLLMKRLHEADNRLGWVRALLY